MPDLSIIHGHDNCTFVFIELAPEAVEGVSLPCGGMMGAEDLPDDDLQKDVLVQFNADYTAINGEPISTFAGHGWDALQWAYERLGSLDGAWTCPIVV